MNAILREVPDFAVSTFFGATLCALTKKDGGIRPIAVGNTMRRLAAKVGARPLSHSLGSELRPVQLGYSTKGGCEADDDAPGETELLFRAVLPNVRVVHLDNCSLLGAPLSDTGIPAEILRKKENLDLMVSRLQAVDNHQAFVLLRNAFSISKLQYVLRASPAVA